MYICDLLPNPIWPGWQEQSARANKEKPHQCPYLVDASAAWSPEVGAGLAPRGGRGDRVDGGR